MPSHACEADQERRRFTQVHERLRAAIVVERRPLTVAYRHCPQPVPWADRLAGTYQPIAAGSEWGRDWDSAWFHLRGRVPEEWHGAQVMLEIDIDGEGLVYTANGEAWQGISFGSVFDTTSWKGTRPWVWLSETGRGGDELEYWLEAASLAIRVPSDPEEPGAAGRHGSRRSVARTLDLIRIDPDAEALAYDFEVLRELEQRLDDRSDATRTIRRGLREACDRLGREPGGYAAARELLAPLLVGDGGQPGFTLQAIGQAHLDTAWLWRRPEAVRKFARTTANQLRLMDRYPEHRFGASSAVHYRDLEARHPELVARIAERVADGRWELQGGMWVECDANLPDGESLLRQFLYGKRYFQQRFGIEVRNAWLPDVFGYSPALPQIIRAAGCTAFLTQKLSWSKYNRFPHKAFRWRGIDGSEILTHFPPEDTYSSNLLPGELLRAEERFIESDVLPRAVSLFGHGDGGGGPHERQLERARRLGHGRYTPAIEFGPAQPVLDAMAERAGDLVCWDGELYLENHRGTLTSQRALKQHNRRLEQRLRGLEKLWCCAQPARYPREDLTAIWHELLILQFHDILPGSSITSVNDDALVSYRALHERCDELEARYASEHAETTEPAGWTLFNSLDVDWAGLLAWPHATLPADVPIHRNETGVWIQVTVPAHGRVELQADPDPSREQESPASLPKPADRCVLENEHARYVFDDQGRLIEAYDRVRDRQLIAPGRPANIFTLYHDRPTDWDAWNIDRSYRDQAQDSLREVDIRRGTDTAAAQELVISGRIGDSTITQRCRLAADEAGLELTIDVDWREDHRMLRLAFPLDLRAPRATCDCAYGHVQRDLHTNTSWELARFEVCAHQWVALQDADAGCALLNDGTYGYHLADGLIDACLLRAPRHPDPDCDRGRHRMRFVLLPIAADPGFDATRHAAMCLNRPPFILPGSVAVDFPVTIQSSGVHLETCKRAEDDDALILRLVERRGANGVAGISSDQAGTVATIDAIEWRHGPARPLGEGHRDRWRAFEIRQLRLT